MGSVPLADVHRTQISRIESGTRTPRIGTAIRLAAALEVDLTTLPHGISFELAFFLATLGRFQISDRRSLTSTPRSA